MIITMRKKIYFILLFMILMPSALKADEGMWTLYNLPNAVYETMKQENYELPYGALYEGDDAIKNCVVLFGGSATLRWNMTICSTASCRTRTRRNCPTRIST